MTAITNYTDTDTVRSLLGISDKEVKDEAFNHMNLDDKLLSELTEWLPTHGAVYTAGTGGAATDAQKNDLRNLKLYASYFCASQIDLFQLAVISSVGDGKNLMKRFEGIDFQALAANLAGETAVYRARLEDTVNSATAVAYTPMGKVGTTYDPVTHT